MAPSTRTARSTIAKRLATGDRAALAAHRRLLVSARRHADRRVLADRRAARGAVAARPGRRALSRPGMSRTTPVRKRPPGTRRASARRDPRRGAGARASTRSGFAAARLDAEARAERAWQLYLRRKVCTATWTGSAQRAERRGRSADAVARGAHRDRRSALNYGPAERSAAPARTSAIAATISVYAQGRDYHDVMKTQAEGARPLRSGTATGIEVKVFVDTAPVMEKPLAQARRHRLAGQAHQSGVARLRLLAVPGRDLLSISSCPRTAREADHCGQLPRAASMSARPTPSRRPTGSMRGAASPISPSSTRGRSRASSRPLIGNRIYGCDDCLAVCPWNKFAQAAQRARVPAARRTDRARVSPISPHSTMPAFRRLFCRHRHQAHRPRPLRAQRRLSRSATAAPRDALPALAPLLATLASGAGRCALGAGELTGSP